MALKTSFEDSNVISSPFVDEIVNPGHTAIERVRSAVNKQMEAARIDNIISKRADEKKAPKKKSEPTKSGFASPGIKGRRDFINEELLGNKKK